MSNNLPVLAGVPLPDGPLATTEGLRNYLESVRGKANIVMPVAIMDFIPPMTRVSIRPLMIDTEIKERTYKKSGGGTGTAWQGTDTYRDMKFCEENERALSKVGIVKLFNAAAISIAFSDRIDDASDPYYCNWRVVVDIPQPDGKIQRRIANKVIDLRPGAAAITKLSGPDLENQRLRITEYAESKALNRVARDAMGLRQKYTVEELQKPWLIPVLVPDLDITDPEIKRMVAAKQLDIVNAVFGGRQQVFPGQALPPGVGPGGEVIDSVVVEDDDPDDTGDTGDDIGPLPAKAQAPPPVESKPIIYNCACPCGCKAEVSKAVHDATKREGGAPRCRECWPTKFYDTKKHANLADMGTVPKMTPAEFEKIAATKR
jgi:hypothetical protein